MQDERNTPQEKDPEEVEAHHLHRGPAEEPNLKADEAEDEDEVEAHHLHRSPMEHLHRDISE
jgi:hypothetical protein